MKKFLVIALLFCSIGVTSLQATVSWKRAWVCTNSGNQTSQSVQQWLKKNNCTEEEIKAGGRMNNLILGVAIALPIGVNLGAVGVAAGVEAAVVIKREARKNELESKYGENWKARCEEIVSDPKISEGSRGWCHRHLKNEERRQLGIVEDEKRRLHEGERKWSETSPWYND